MELIPILLIFAAVIVLKRTKAMECNWRRIWCQTAAELAPAMGIYRAGIKNISKLQAVCDQEAVAGWDLFEKAR